MGAPRGSTALLWPRGDQAFKTGPLARGACRAKEARPRQEELAGTTEPEHQGPGGRSPPGRPNLGTTSEARRGAPCAPARPDERQALRRGKTTTATSHLPRQVATSELRSSS